MPFTGSLNIQLDSVPLTTNSRNPVTRTLKGNKKQFELAGVRLIKAD